MVTQSEAIVQPALLRWAQQRGTKSLRSLQNKFKDWDSWTNGTKFPTLSQAQTIADYTNLPFGILMLSEPPSEDLPIHDFRAGHDTSPHTRLETSKNLLDTIMQNQRRQDWYENYLASVGADTPLEFVKSSHTDTPQQAAQKIRKMLRYEVKDRSKFKTTSETRNHLINAFENIGGLVVISSMVGNNTTRVLDNSEFRGFTLHSTIAPLVFINSAGETLNAQVFSLLHEFAHVWRGDTGISGETRDTDTEIDPRNEFQNQTANPSSNPDIERWCNQVASEVAIPEKDLTTRVKQLNGDLTETLSKLAGIYKCSTLVVLIRLREVGLLPWEGFRKIYDTELQRLAEKSTEQKKTGGGNFYHNQHFRIGQTLSRAIIRDLARGRTSPTQAMRLLDFKKMSTVDKYSRDYLKEE